MNFQEPLKTSAIDLNKIVYPKIKNGDTKKLVLIKYNDKSKLKNFVFQTPTMLNLFKPELNGNYADIELALVGKEKNKINKFVKFLNQLENKIKHDAQYHANEWFNLENENQSINFQKIIRDSDEYNEGTLKMKIIKNNDFETVLQINNTKKINVNMVPEDSWCKMILECFGIWINSRNDFGIFFRPILISFTPKEKEIYNYKFIDDSDEEVVDIPDTEVNHNIFMKIDSNNKNSLDDSTTQLEYNQLVNEIETDSVLNKQNIVISAFHSEEPLEVFKRDDGTLDINLDDKYYSDDSSESNSDNSKENYNDTNNDTDINSDNDSDNDTDIDAETSTLNE